MRARWCPIPGFVDVQTLGLDFHADALTIFGGTLGPPHSYAVNLGTADTAIAASLSADAHEATVDAQPVPTADIPPDPTPMHVVDGATVFGSFQLYRRLIPRFVYVNELGVIRSVPVVNSRELYFFGNGRALARFRNYRAGRVYPNTTVDICDNWAAYHIAPRRT